jgi:hypothetical protein
LRRTEIIIAINHQIGSPSPVFNLLSHIPSQIASCRGRHSAVSGWPSSITPVKDGSIMKRSYARGRLVGRSQNQFKGRRFTSSDHDRIHEHSHPGDTAAREEDMAHREEGNLSEDGRKDGHSRMGQAEGHSRGDTDPRNDHEGADSHP